MHKITVGVIKYRHVNLTLVRILLGLFIMAAGIATTIKGNWLYENFGTIAFFDDYFRSSGGGRAGYKIMGMLATLVGILVLTNIHAQILQAIANLFVFGGR